MVSNYSRFKDFNSWPMIFNIQRFSTHDGHGIRTMIFYKGCPLSCKWCCNPESQAFGPDLMFDRRLCKNFRDCLEAGKNAITPGSEGININRSAVDKPEKFRDVCASRALTVSGNEISVSALLLEIDKDMPFYNGSGGGVTLSGGEPLAHGAEIEILLDELKQRSIDTAIETSLHVSWDMIERCINLTDTFLVDMKHTDKEKFRQFTGGDSDLVLNNLKKLAQYHHNIIIRIPVIPGFNHTEQEIKKMIDFSVSLETVREIHFLPFHNLGSEKYKMLGMQYTYSGKKQVDSRELESYTDYARSLGLTAKTGG
jgi:pyruvate formate lyase activating enzyme